ncbi:hypothetical protein D9M69_572700 [compost metagenome]
MGFLAFAVAEHPGLDDLVGLANLGGDHRLGILQCLEADGSSHQGANEVERPALPAIRDLGREVTSTGDGEVGAWWVGDQQVPAPIEQFSYIAQDVFAFGFRGQQVATHCIKANAGEGIADAAGEFAGHQGRRALRHDSGLLVEWLANGHEGRRFAAVVHNVPVLRGAAGGRVFRAG